MPFDFGPCCACEGLEGVRNIVMLAVKMTVPGKGWGCLVCGLSFDGAIAVLCDACIDKKAEPRFAVDGPVEEKSRVLIGELTVPHQHDLSRHPEERDRGRS